jgi:hypothetical protein
MTLVSIVALYVAAGLRFPSPLSLKDDFFPLNETLPQFTLNLHFSFARPLCSLAVNFSLHKRLPRRDLLQFDVEVTSTGAYGHNSLILQSLPTTKRLFSVVFAANSSESDSHHLLRNETIEFNNLSLNLAFSAASFGDIDGFLFRWSFVDASAWLPLKVGLCMMSALV